MKPYSNSCIAFALTTLILAVCVSCADPPNSGNAKEAPDTHPKSEPSLLKNIYDRATEIGPKANERATDPGEKARLGGDDPTLPPPEDKSNDDGSRSSLLR